MAINLSDYNRSGIFIDEVNSSTINKPIANEATVNFIPGFSRKGTVFNRPVLLKSTSDRNTYFGDIDRFLEKKGSYFHRTIDVALQTAPVWAMNLLKTTSLDTLNYASVSVSAQFDNDPIQTRQYDDFFNKSGFWQRDVESFMTFAQNSERMLHFTNVSDKKLTVFMFKSSTPGYDITAEVWYGGKDKVPTWMNYSDLISDYLVRVVVVSGDWSNYVNLAADSNWSKYFASSGLRKTKVNDFIKDKNVSLLGDYNGSLIPYFRDNKNNNIFIESMININTDKTGLFASYDLDNVEMDFPNGNVDVIGQTLVDNSKGKINFMSYQDTIEEIDTYSNQELDALGNAIGIKTLNGATSTRTTANTNGKLSGLVTSVVGSPTTANPTITVTSTSGTAVINNTLLSVATTPFTGLTALTALGTVTATTKYRIDTLYIDATGIVNLVNGTEVELANGLIESAAVTAGLTYPATMANNAIVLGYIFRTKTFAGVHANTYVPVALTTTGYIELNIGSAGTDIVVANTVTTILNLTFTGTQSATKGNYKAWRSLQFFNELVTKKVLSNSVLIDSDGAKIDLTNATWSDNYASTLADKNITITVTGVDIKTRSYTNNELAFYYNDNEFIMNRAGLETRALSTGTTNYGVVAKGSKFYLDYYNGMINTGDYFYENMAATTSLKFIHYTNTANPTYVGDWITMSAADAAALGLIVGANNLHISIQAHPVNAGDFSLSTGVAYASLPADFQASLTAGDIVFASNALVTTYTTTQALNIYNFDNKLYLKMYTIGSTLHVDFKADNTLLTAGTVSALLLGINGTINVYSGESSYEQTLEIETNVNYTITDNKFLIDLTRYPEVKVGDYVKAYSDPLLLVPGQFPKKFARIVKKAPWALNASENVQYAEVTTDIKVDITDFAGDLQITRYTTIEDYIDTYKAISLGGFAVQAASIPDGTETRQSEILNVIGNTTALFNAIVNKNKFNFRYLIDSFGLGLTEFSKQQLSDITGTRKNCIGFINMPSVKNFKKSSSPSFINTDGTLNLEYVKTGGNLEQNPPFLYSLAQGDGSDDGRGTIGYFFPYVTVNDNGRPMIFPPAAYAANTYMRKIDSSVSGTYNWTVAAGVTDGRILGISDVEQDFTATDLEHMYAMGVNPIMYAKNTGFYLETEFTADTTQLSSLSYLHSREVLIDLENELYAMLFKYQYKFNTPAVRAKIKREADDICQKFVDKSALYAFENIIDETNNTPTVIDNSFGILETRIEIVKAMQIIVNVINVLPTGGIAGSTGFN